MEITRVKKVSLTDQVYSQLKRMLLSGEWAEGTMIPSENALCREFSVSRVVVREALQMLRAEKLIVTRHGMGTFVANPGNFLPSTQPFNLSEESYRDFLEFRSAVEISAVRLGCEKATEADYRRMEECLQEMNDAWDDNDRYNLADYNFHYAVVCASHNDMLIQAMAANQANIIRIITAMNAVPDARSFAVPAHRQIMENIRAGETRKVVAAYKDMGKYNLTRLSRFFKKEETGDSATKESAIGNDC